MADITATVIAGMTTTSIVRTTVAGRAGIAVIARMPTAVAAATSLFAASGAPPAAGQPFVTRHTCEPRGRSRAMGPIRRLYRTPDGTLTPG
jgi:hypothetical protein